MEDMRTIVREMQRDLKELEVDEFRVKSLDRLVDKSRASTLAAIFLEFPGLSARGLLINLGSWWEELTYQEVEEAMLAVGGEDLPAYYFAFYIPELFGVDVIRAARDIQERHPSEGKRVRFFAGMKKLLGPTAHALEYLTDAGASPARIRESLEQSGAPMMPLPDTA